MCSSHIQDSFCRIFLFETIKQKKGRNGNAEEAADTAGLDAESRTILHSKEVLAVILLETVEEYKGYSIKEVMDFIEADSITECEEVSAGRTNTQVRGDNPEFVHLNEKAAHFDVMFRARNPRLSRGRVIVNLHINVESQKTYRPGYPHQSNFMDTISEYIDFSNNEELWKETEHMEGLGESILREGIEEGIRLNYTSDD